MYRGYIGTFFSHLLSLMSSLWAIGILSNANLPYKELKWIKLAFLLTIINSSIALVRYGSSTYGYKLKKLHIFTLNLSAVIGFSILEFVYHCLYGSPEYLVHAPILNLFPFILNLQNKDYRTRTSLCDGIIALNSLVICLMSYAKENYFAVALNLSYVFGYFLIGDCGFVFDTELPSIDAYQYLTCFLNAFTVYSFIY